ncbi:ABC transporter permease [Mesorhizobium retamae]|uniref:ABC transporter permease n=1 Tax=Mesorhizobium retamae TaxID=2912854 RepID=A0ABS9QD88_9HYPH|nr:ABC transporter permease [Mesorhizobium sp. IRAMC:0171]MCG7505389.1 ABC transporter permease [Mesorhizobium sp. IRAMC:0171]
MLNLITRRLFFALLALFATSVIVFAATEVLPGDVAQAILGQEATPELLKSLRQELGLNRSPVERYFSWLGGFVTGDLGHSLASKADVLQTIKPRLANTLALAAYAAIVAVPLSVLLGIICAAYPNRLIDRIFSVVSVFIVSIPEFVVGLLLVSVFAVQLRWFPAVVVRLNWSEPLSLLVQLMLPMLTLLCTIVAHTVRMTRAALLDVLSMPYIEMALLKGMSRWRIILRHGLPNAIGPIASVVALNLGYLVSGVALVEVVFAYPGLGRLMVDSISYRDLPLIQATAMIMCLMFIIFNLIADILAVLFKPRGASVR